MAAAREGLVGAGTPFRVIPRGHMQLAELHGPIRVAPRKSDGGLHMRDRLGEFPLVPQDVGQMVVGLRIQG